MWKLVRKFLHREGGLETVEWAVVGGMVVFVGALAFSLIGQDTRNSLGKLTNTVAASAGNPPPWSPPGGDTEPPPGHQ